jgi:hypothetical protein
MPNKEFLEEYPLYRKFTFEGAADCTNQLQKVPINMPCKVCKAPQTFVMSNEYWEVSNYVNTPLDGLVSRLIYECAHCKNSKRVFVVLFNTEGARWFMKIGQYPAWKISGNADIEKLLGDHADYYQKGLVCESQGYGIGAFGYYRRIVEETIDSLLDQVSDLLSGDEKVKYDGALAQVKKTIVTQEKIDLVKDLLPPILRPTGMNPLSVLHSTLSEGLHVQSDEICLGHAAQVRSILVFLVTQIKLTGEASKTFTDSMKKLLDKRAKK